MVRLAAGVERGAPGRAFHPALDPGLLVGILDVHELDADRAAIGLAQDGLDLAQRRGFAAEHVVDEDRLVEVVVGETIGARIELGVRRWESAARADRAAPPDGRARGRSGSASARAARRWWRRGSARRTAAPPAPGAAHGPVTAGRTSSSNSGWRGAQEAPVASSSTERASSFSAPNSSAKVGSTEAGLAAQRAYCSPRNAAFAPLKAEARMSTPAIRQESFVSSRSTTRTWTRSRDHDGQRAGARRVASSAWPISGKHAATSGAARNLVNCDQGERLLTTHRNPARWLVPGMPDPAPYRRPRSMRPERERSMTILARHRRLDARPQSPSLCGHEPPVAASAWAQAGPPQVTVATPLASRVAQWDEFTGRFEATAARRGAPARLRLHRPGAFPRRQHRQAGRPAVHHRPASVPARGRIGAGRRGAHQGAGRAGRRRLRARRSNW